MESQQDENNMPMELISVVNKLLFLIVVLVIGIVLVPIFFYFGNQPDVPRVKIQDSVGSNTEVKIIASTFWIDAPQTLLTQVYGVDYKFH